MFQRIVDNWLLALTCGLTIGGGAPALAEGSMSDGPPGGFYSAQTPYNVEHGHYQRHASTATEGAYRGMSAYVQALGVYEVHHAQANVLNEQAEWLDYENREKRVESFYNRRRTRQDYLAEQRELAEQRDAEGKQKLEQRKATLYRQTYSLSEREFNPRTGHIDWPDVFELPDLVTGRQQLSELFVRRARYGRQYDSQLAAEIVRVQKELNRSLYNARFRMTHEAYAAASDFLRGLKYEAMYPAKIG